MKKSAHFLIILAVLFILPFHSAFANGANFESGVITATGNGARPAMAVNPAQAIAMAKRAAILDAYRNLAEYINGVNIDSETTVKNFANTDDVIKTKVSALIKGAKIVDEYETAGGGYSVIMQIPIYGAKRSLASAVIPKEKTVKEPFPAPLPNIAPSIPNTPSSTVKPPVNVPEVSANNTPIGGFTGVIVDCTGLGLDTAMSPVIKDTNGRKIYGHKNLDVDHIIANGMVTYSNGMTNVQRAGAKPIVVTALRVENHSINPVVSLEDANRLLIENEVSHFFEATNVVFVR